jgi:hypothetical protein
MRIYNDVRGNGNEMEIPVIEKPHTKLPKVSPVKLPFADKDYFAPYNGFRDILSAGYETTASKGQELDDAVVSKYGTKDNYLKYLSQREFLGGDSYANYLRRERSLKEREVGGSKDIAYEATMTADILTIDMDGLNDFFDFPDLGINYCIEKYSNDSSHVSPSNGLYDLLSMGFVSIKSGAASEMDRMVRMGSQIRRLGLREILNDPDAIEEVLKKRARGFPVVTISCKSQCEGIRPMKHDSQMSLFSPTYIRDI